MKRFLLQFLKNPRSIGAVAPSSQYLAAKMMAAIDFSSAKCIVEFGPGTGSFTKELVKRKKEKTVLLLIEQNPVFCRNLRSQYGKCKNVFVIQDSAEYVEKYLTMHEFSHADYIVSGLPFTSLHKEVSHRIFVSTQKVLGIEGTFITFQYSMIKQKLFLQYFELVGHHREYRNVPPAHILTMKVEGGAIEKGRKMSGRLYSNCG